MNMTDYHAKLFAHELTKRSSSDNVDKLASALSDAQVDLNPHQIEAALFAFRSHSQKARFSLTKLVSERQSRRVFCWRSVGPSDGAPYWSSVRQTYVNSGARSY
jgi:hypothetical protein